MRQWENRNNFKSALLKINQTHNFNSLLKDVITLYTCQIMEEKKEEKKEWHYKTTTLTELVKRYERLFY